MEFIRRRLEGGTLYALLAEESSNYLHVGPFADADMELLGTGFAKVCCCGVSWMTDPLCSLGDVGTTDKFMDIAWSVQACRFCVGPQPFSRDDVM